MEKQEEWQFFFLCFHIHTFHLSLTFKSRYINITELPRWFNANKSLGISQCGFEEDLSGFGITCLMKTGFVKSKDLLSFCTIWGGLTARCINCKWKKTCMELWEQSKTNMPLQIGGFVEKETNSTKKTFEFLFIITFLHFHHSFPFLPFPSFQSQLKLHIFHFPYLFFSTFLFFLFSFFSFSFYVKSSAKVNEVQTGSSSGIRFLCKMQKLQA